MLRINNCVSIITKSCIILSAIFLSGCGGTELENKSFPLAVLVESQNDQYRVCYLAQNLSEVSNEERADGGNMTASSAVGSTYYETQKAYEKNNRCQLDLSHTKAVVFQKDFIKNGALELFLETVKKENIYARNTLVYLADSSMEKLAELNSKLEVPFGSYLEQMVENEQDIKEQAVVTLGALLNEQANADRIIILPVLKAENGMPAIYEYELLENFRSKGRIDTQAAQIYYLLKGQLQQMDLHLDTEEQVKLNHISCSRDFIRTGNRVTQQLVLTADTEQITGGASEDDIEQMLHQKIDEVLRSCQEDMQVDLSDSYRYLPMHSSEIYRLYENSSEEYNCNLDYQIQVHVRKV